MNFEFNWPCGLRGENIEGRTPDGRQSDWYTISAPMS